jgi:uncharacterized protein
MTVRIQRSADVCKGEGDRRIRAVVSTASPDRDGDCVLPRGLQLANYLKNPVVPFGHSYRDLPVGRTVELSVTDRAVSAVIEFAGHPQAQAVCDLYKGGFLSAFSVGFSPIEWVPNEHGGRTYNKAELLEISCVPVPANAEALVVARSKGLELEEPIYFLADDTPVDLTAEDVRRAVRESVAQEYIDIEPTEIARIVTDAVSEKLRQLSGKLD